MLLGRGCAREWKSRWSSVDVVSCVVCRWLRIGEKRSGRVGGMGNWGTGHNRHGHTGEILALGRSRSHNHHCRTAKNCLQ